MNKNKALILGIMLGDGLIGIYSKYQHKVIITGHYMDDKPFLVDFVKPLLEEIFHKKVSINIRKNCKAMDLIIYSKEVLFHIHKNWEYQIGKKNEIFISNKFLNNSKIMRKIISGFFATDGCLVITNNNGTIYPRVEFQNKSFTILKQIKDFLLEIDIKGGLYKMNRPNRTIYRLQYNGKKKLLKFKEEIEFINPKHKLKFKNFIKEAGVV